MAPPLPNEPPPSEGDFTQLLATHQRQLFGLIFGMVHSVADAEDVFQQSSLVMWQKFDEFQTGTNFVAWAASIARFKAIDFLRSKGRDRLQFSAELLEQFVDQQEAGDQTSEARLLSFSISFLSFFFLGDQCHNQNASGAAPAMHCNFFRCR